MIKRMKKKTYLFVLLSLLCVAFAHAQYVAPSEGVFRIISAEFNAAMMENSVNSTLECTAIGDDGDYEQMWVLKQLGSGYSLQNVLSGAYIQTGNNNGEVPYETGATAKTFNIVKNASKGEDCYNIWDSTQSQRGLHSKGTNGYVTNYVSESNSKKTEWKFVKLDITEEQIAEAREVYKNFKNQIDKGDSYQSVLEKVFEDAACTKLSSDYAAKSVDELRAELESQLAPTLLDMVIKTKTGDWTEANEKADKPGWDSDYAKKFRVQLIEPHSIAGEITSWFGYNAHTNMDNPIGVYANKLNVLYVMVEGEIKEGAELWANWIVGHSKMPNYNNGYSNGVRLRSGLNIVPFGSDGSALYINYLVHTYNTGSGTFPHKLSEYDDLKVHVEGGYINSYYNAWGDALYTADTDADWEYYEERANLHNITVLGNYQVLQFELNDVVVDGSTEKGLRRLFPDMLPTSLPENQRINAIVEAWDRIMLSELMTLGVVSKEIVDSMNTVYPRWDGKWENKAEIYNYEGYAEYCGGRDYGEYYNHRGVAYGTVTGYMYGSWDHCGYHINTTESILTRIATESGATWGPGHEIGHQHQGLFTVNGLTEVTNNLFSNIAVWYMGIGTSRMNGTEGNLAHVYDNFKAGGDFFGNNIWALTHMYYRLWLYYHRAGNNTQFYPRLFELLRNNPIQKTGYYQAGKTSILHFYQLCCDAAQEDLTEFFRAHGFFKVMNNRYVGDYSNSEYTQSQADIDEAIAAVKAKGYPVNDKPLFINDCTPEATYSHDGKTQRSYWDGNVTTNGTNAEIGSYMTYVTADTTLGGKYLYELSDLKVKISGGTGAVGFAIYNKEGEIQAFSSHHSFVVTEEVDLAVRTGEATIVAVAPFGEGVRVPSKAAEGSEEEQYKALKASLAAANDILKLSDDKGVNVGYFKADHLVALQALVGEAQTAYDNKDTSVHTYGEWAIALDQMVLSLTENEDAKVPVYEEDYYALYSVRHKNNSVEYSTAGLKVTFASPEENPKKQWVLVPSDEEDQYYVQNVESGLYVSVASENVRVKAEAKETKNAIAFYLIEAEPSRFLLQSVKNTALYLSSDNSKNVVAVNGASANAHWTISSVVDNHSAAVKAKLEGLIGMVAITLNELVAATEPELKFYDDITILDEALSTYVVALQAAYEAARKAVAGDYAYLEDYHVALDAAHSMVKAAYQKALSLPGATNDDKVMCYYIQCLDTEAYAYNFEGAGRYNGSIRTGELTNPSDYSYWFYLRPGESEGQYYIYNLRTGKPAGTSGRYVYVNGTVDATVFTLTVSTDVYGYTITAADGAWNVQSGDNGYVQFTSKPAQWLLVPIGVYDVAGIESVEQSAVSVDMYYDLQGRPVANPTSGIYIRGGRKIIVK